MYCTSGSKTTPWRRVSIALLDGSVHGCETLCCGLSSAARGWHQRRRSYAISSISIICMNLTIAWCPVYWCFLQHPACNCWQRHVSNHFSSSDFDIDVRAFCLCFHLFVSKNLGFPFFSTFNSSIVTLSMRSGLLPVSLAVLITPRENFAIQELLLPTELPHAIFLETDLFKIPSICAKAAKANEYGSEDLTLYQVHCQDEAEVGLYGFSVYQI